MLGGSCHRPLSERPVWNGLQGLLQIGLEQLVFYTSLLDQSLEAAHGILEDYGLEPGLFRQQALSRCPIHSSNSSQLMEGLSLLG